MAYSPSLIEKTVKVFYEENGLTLSQNEAIAILDSFAGLFSAFEQGKSYIPDHTLV